MRILGDFAFLLLAFIFLVIWLIAWAAFHVAGGFIHILLVIAVIFLIVHFVRGRGRTV
ncbi:MAG: lmo0937 family membrane protein [Acidobacteriota bacterium]|nr:lmo0937 family membrane protein [Acidobacteriota bacterium]